MRTSNLLLKYTIWWRQGR